MAVGPTKQKWLVAIGTLFVFAIIVWAGRNAAQTTTMFSLVLVALLLFIILLGGVISSRPLGIFINDRNLVSLSRFQMVMWTVLILSAYFTLAIHRVRDGTADPLAIGMDWHLWALMGISTTSLVGTPLLLSPKAQKEPDDKIKQRLS
jgi:hypothetical protein